MAKIFKAKKEWSIRPRSDNLSEAPPILPRLSPLITPPISLEILTNLPKISLTEVRTDLTAGGTTTLERKDTMEPSLSSLSTSKREKRKRRKLRRLSLGCPTLWVPVRISEKL